MSFSFGRMRPIRALYKLAVLPDSPLKLPSRGERADLYEIGMRNGVCHARHIRRALDRRYRWRLIDVPAHVNASMEADPGVLRHR